MAESCSADHIPPSHSLGVSASMPQVSYIKAVDVYLWVSSCLSSCRSLGMQLWLHLTTVEERRRFRRPGKVLLAFTTGSFWNVKKAVHHLRPLLAVLQHLYEVRVTWQNASLTNNLKLYSFCSVLAGFLGIPKKVLPEGFLYENFSQCAPLH